MPIDDERLEKLKKLQEQAFDHAVEEMQAASELSLKDKYERTDRTYYTKMCEKSLGVAVRVEQFIALRERSQGYFPPTHDDKKAQDKMIERSQQKLTEYIERSSAWKNERSVDAQRRH